jgi:hypothetical protein
MVSRHALPVAYLTNAGGFVWLAPAMHGDERAPMGRVCAAHAPRTAVAHDARAVGSAAEKVANFGAPNDVGLGALGLLSVTAPTRPVTGDEFDRARVRASYDAAFTKENR